MTKRLLNRLRSPAAIVIAAMTAYAVLLCWACHAKYVAYAYDDFDLAIDAQTLWNLCHGSMQSSIHGIVFLGNHMRLILFPLAPVYALVPSPLLLLYLQTFALASGSWALFLLVRREISARWAAALAVIYLLYPPLITMNLYEFHPVAFVVPFFLYMFYFYRLGRFRLTILFLFLAMACQENISTIAIAFSFYALLDKKKGKWFWVPLSAGVLYFLAAFLVIMPHFNQGTIQFHRLYGPLGDSIPEIMKTVITKPGNTLRIMTQPDKVIYVNTLLAPLGYLSLLSPMTLIPCLPVLAQRLLSSRAAETTLAYHYQAEFIAFLFVSAATGLRRALQLKFKLARPLVMILLVVFPLLSLVLTDAPGRVLDPIADCGKPEVKQATQLKNHILETIDPDSSVLATFEFLPRLSNRKHLYSLHHVYTGSYTLSDIPYPVPPDISTIVMHTRDRLTFTYEGFYTPESYTNLQAILGPGDWSTAHNIGTYLVLEKNAGESAPLPVTAGPVPENTNRNIRQFYGDSTELIGFDIAATANGDSAALTLYWKTPPLVENEFDILLTLEESGKILFTGELSPGHRIWPPQSWEPGSIVTDEHGIPLNENIPLSTNTQVTILFLGIP